ncbi:MAG: dihydroflavonol-4-reductase [Glaciecola sp.]
MGRHLVQDFLQAGYHVHVMCRETSDRSVLNGCAVSFYNANLLSPEKLTEALMQAKSIAGEAPLWMVHNAALISYSKHDRQSLVDTNVSGVRNVLTASHEAGIRRFVHVSSIVAIGFAEHGVARTEEQAFNAGCLNVAYVDTKRRGEELALLAPSDLQVRVVNPGAIFGPVQANSNSARFLQGMAQGEIGTLAPPGGMAVVGVRDCARGVRLALECGQAGRRYCLAESYLSSRQLFAAVGQRLAGRDPVRATVPAWVWRMMGLGLSLVSVVREPKLTSPQAMRMLGVAFDASGERARNELGWQPRPFGEVLDWTIDEMRRMGILPKV